MTLKIISVFGSARPQPEDPVYRMAYDIGKLLGQAGFGVATGGYMGVMEAASKGCAEAGGHVIGVTSDRIETFRPIGPNRYIAEEIRYPTLRDRMLHVVDHNDGMVVMPGGIGTLAELAVAWNAMQTGEIGRRPIVVVGSHWRTTMNHFIIDEFVRETDAALIQFAETAAEAASMMVGALNGHG